MPGTIPVKFAIEKTVKGKKETEEYFINNWGKSLPLPETYQTKEPEKSMMQKAKHAIVVGYDKDKQSVAKSYPLKRDKKNQSVIIYTPESDKNLFSKVECVVFMEEDPTKVIKNHLEEILNNKDYKDTNDLYRKYIAINFCLSKYRIKYKMNILPPVLVPNGPALANDKMEQTTTASSSSSQDKQEQNMLTEYTEVMHSFGSKYLSFSAEFARLIKKLEKDQCKIAENLAIADKKNPDLIKDLTKASDTMDIVLKSFCEVQKQLQEQLKGIEKLFDVKEILELDTDDVKNKLVEFKRAFDETFSSKIGPVIDSSPETERSALNTALREFEEAYNAAQSYVNNLPTSTNLLNDPGSQSAPKSQTSPSNNVQSSSGDSNIVSIISISSTVKSNTSPSQPISSFEGQATQVNDQPPQAEAKRSVWKKVLIGVGIGLGITTAMTAVAGVLLLTGGTAAAPIIIAGAAVGHFLGIASMTVSLSSIGAALMSAGSAIGGLVGGVVARFQSRRMPTVAETTETPLVDNSTKKMIGNLSPVTATASNKPIATVTASNPVTVITSTPAIAKASDTAKATVTASNPAKATVLTATAEEENGVEQQPTAEQPSKTQPSSSSGNPVNNYGRLFQGIATRIKGMISRRETKTAGNRTQRGFINNEEIIDRETQHRSQC